MSESLVKAIDSVERAEEMLDELARDGNKVVGCKQTRRALEKGAAAKVFLAKDADETAIGDLKSICEESNVELCEIDTMDELGKACGIEVGAAAVAILKK